MRAAEAGKLARNGARSELQTCWCSLPPSPVRPGSPQPSITSPASPPQHPQTSLAPLSAVPLHPPKAAPCQALPNHPVFSLTAQGNLSLPAVSQQQDKPHSSPQTQGWGMTADPFLHSSGRASPAQER